MSTQRGRLVVELPVPVQLVDGRWLVAVWIDSGRPDITPSHAIPMLVPDLDRWEPGA